MILATKWGARRGVRTMRHRRGWAGLLVAAALMIAAAAQAPLALAFEQISATGDAFFVITPISARQVDDRTIAIGTIAITFTGTVTGSSVGELRDVFGGTAAEHFIVISTCTCAIAGVGSGTLTMNVEGPLGGPPAGGSATAPSRIVIVSGTGDLVNVSGEGYSVPVGPGHAEYFINLVVSGP